MIKGVQAVRGELSGLDKELSEIFAADHEVSQCYLLFLNLNTNPTNKLCSKTVQIHSTSLTPGLETFPHSPIH